MQYNPSRTLSSTVAAHPYCKTLSETQIGQTGGSVDGNQSEKTGNQFTQTTQADQTTENQSYLEIILLTG